MKRIKKFARYRRHQRSRAKSEARSRRARLAFVKRKRRAVLGLQGIERADITAGVLRKDFETVAAPRELSLINSPDETLYFFHRVRQQYDQRKPTFVSLRSVKRADHDAIGILLALMLRFKNARIGFNGDIPANIEARNSLLRSNFLRILGVDKSGGDVGKYRTGDVYHIGNENTFYTHGNKKVDSEKTAKLIEAAAYTVWGEARRCPLVQKIFVELMQNTNNHASPTKQGDKHWWVSIDHHKNKVMFSFVDFGVGVFRSLDAKAPHERFYNFRTKMLDVYGGDDNAGLLRYILNGKMHQTISGKYYRGKGLPVIREAVQMNGVARLVIITNDVYGDVAKDVYKPLRVPFRGTFIYWELTKKNASLGPLI